MASFNLIIIIGLFAIVGFLILLFALSDDSAKTKKKKHEDIPASVSQKWEEVIAKLEKYIYSLKNELESLKTEQKKHLRDLAVERARNERLQEKLKQENEWLAKEKVAIEKKDEEIRDFKIRVVKLEQEREHEYAARLQTERQLKELKGDYDVLVKEKRELSFKAMTLEADLDVHKKEVARLKKANKELSRESDEAEWVSKSEYERLEKALQDKEKELKRIRED
ncbi:MAG TPA: hypothetical protein PL155_04875 [Candidatus Omnitrophota bacterium]|nr:hypothetical protein [Candidatus Omnitrophota bacterium]HPD84188.1 hypothetical protein [Candidatus Omnitrophota bacterium]HRZ03044.1 hypothetical protein [Candidatus Omnitrophota bacterium]